MRAGRAAQLAGTLEGLVAKACKSCARAWNSHCRRSVSPGFPLLRCRPSARHPGREEATQPQLCLLLHFCSVINSSGDSLLFKHPVLPKPYLGGVFPQHMLEFTVSAAALQSTFGFSHPQTAVLIRGGFPLLSWGGQAQQLAFYRDPSIVMGELSLQEGGGRAPSMGHRALGSSPKPWAPAAGWAL